MRNHKRMMDRAARKIERERGKMEQQEKKCIKEIQKLAKQGQHVILFVSLNIVFSKQPRSWRKMLLGYAAK